MDHPAGLTCDFKSHSYSRTHGYATESVHLTVLEDKIQCLSLLTADFIYCTHLPRSQRTQLNHIARARTQLHHITHMCLVFEQRNASGLPSAHQQDRADSIKPCCSFKWDLLLPVVTVADGRLPTYLSDTWNYSVHNHLHSITIRTLLICCL